MRAMGVIPFAPGDPPMKSLAEFTKTTLIGGLLIILPIYVAVLLLLKAVKGLLGLLDPVASRIPAEHFRGIAAILLLVVICFVVGVIVRTGPGLRAKNAVEQAVFEKMPGYTFLRGLIKRLTGSSEEQTLQPALVEIEEALVPALIVEGLEDGSYPDGGEHLHPAARTRASGRHLVYYGHRRVLKMGHGRRRVRARHEDCPGRAAGRPAGPA